MQFVLYFVFLLIYLNVHCIQFVSNLPDSLNNTYNLNRTDDENLINCNSLNYLMDTKRKKINALASFPGSGNTWLRHLLQQSTGLLTGSVYRDFELENKNLPGIQDSSVLLVKTHQLPDESFPTFDRAVVLIRNPFKALLAEFNRQAAGHLGYVPITKKFLQRKDWVLFVINSIQNWKQFYIKWLQFKRPILLVTYENLLLNVHCQLEHIIQFLNQPVYQDRLLKCTLNTPMDRFKRAGHLFQFDPFSIHVNGSSLRRLVEKERRIVYKYIEDNFRNNLICKRKEVSEIKIG